MRSRLGKAGARLYELPLERVRTQSAPRTFRAGRFAREARRKCIKMHNSCMFGKTALSGACSEEKRKKSMGTPGRSLGGWPLPARFRYLAQEDCIQTNRINDGKLSAAAGKKPIGIRKINGDKTVGSERRGMTAKKLREIDPFRGAAVANSGESTEKTKGMVKCAKLSLTNVRRRSIILYYYSPTVNIIHTEDVYYE